MNERAMRRTAWALAALALGGAGIAGTAGTVGSEAMVQAGSFRIEGCSLACTAGPTQVTCGIVNVFVNEEFRIEFNDAVDLSSVSPSSFRIFDVSNGTTPPGSFRLDPADRSTLIFDPQLSFDPLGVPMFGLTWDATYQLVVPGVLAGDPGPYVQSAKGLPVENRMLCTVTADQGVRDYVPGNPSLEALVDVVRTCHTGGPILPAPARGARCVSVDTNLTLIFDDIMNVGTVVIPLTGTAPFIAVRYSDTQEWIPGHWSISVDQQALTTTAVFDPDTPLEHDRWVMVTVGPSVADMILNPVSNGGLIHFRTVDP